MKREKSSARYLVRVGFEKENQMIKAELKDKNVSVEVKGSSENCMIELVSIMTSLLDKSSVDVDDLAYAVALATLMAGGTCIITADHGNAELMFDEKGS